MVINGTTLASASLELRNLWDEAEHGLYQVVLIGPETISKDEFHDFIDHPDVQRRLGYIIIDELHLVYQWGFM